jgi:hypothetical protein
VKAPNFLDEIPVEDKDIFMLLKQLMIRTSETSIIMQSWIHLKNPFNDKTSSLYISCREDLRDFPMQWDYTVVFDYKINRFDKRLFHAIDHWKRKSLSP